PGRSRRARESGPDSDRNRDHILTSRAQGQAEPCLQQFAAGPEAAWFSGEIRHARVDRTAKERGRVLPREGRHRTGRNRPGCKSRRAATDGTPKGRRSGRAQGCPRGIEEDRPDGGERRPQMSPIWFLPASNGIFNLTLKKRRIQLEA